MALVQAYRSDPSLNAQRAWLRDRRRCAAGAVRLSPKLSITAGGGYNYNNAVSNFPLRRADQRTVRANLLLRTVGATVIHAVQRLPDCQSHRQAPRARSMPRVETLRVTEQQQFLLDAATAYMNLLRKFRDPRTRSPQRRGAHQRSSRPATASMSAKSPAPTMRSGGVAAGQPVDPLCSAPSRTM